jgi:hypothetical protein
LWLIANKIFCIFADSIRHDGGAALCGWRRATVRDPYAGDVSDVFKFAFLRALTADDKRLGVAWYYVPGHDGGVDGRHLECASAWRLLDAELHAGLSTLPERTVAALERAPIWPKGVLFHREPMPSRLQRSAWAAGKRSALDGADVVFLDPDNGVRDTQGEKHATYEEIRLLRRTGRAIVFIKLPGHTPHDEQVRQRHEKLMAETGAASAITLRTSISQPRKAGSPYLIPRQRWFTIVDPDATLIERARVFCAALSSVRRVRATSEIM